MSTRALSIPPIPSRLCVVELDEHILITAQDIDAEECIFTCYRFVLDCDPSTPNDDAYRRAFAFAEDISRESGRLVVDIVDYHSYDPHIYDPKQNDERLIMLAELIKNEREKFADLTRK